MTRPGTQIFEFAPAFPRVCASFRSFQGRGGAERALSDVPAGAELLSLREPGQPNQSGPALSLHPQTPRIGLDIYDRATPRRRGIIRRRTWSAALANLDRWFGGPSHPVENHRKEADQHRTPKCVLEIVDLKMWSQERAHDEQQQSIDHQGKKSKGQDQQR